MLLSCKKWLRMIKSRNVCTDLIPKALHKKCAALANADRQRVHDLSVSTSIYWSERVRIRDEYSYSAGRPAGR